MEIGFTQWLSIIFGAFFIWTGIFLLSKNPFSSILRIISISIFAFGFSTITDPILSLTSSSGDYFFWQKITDWPLFFVAVFFFNIVLIESRQIAKTNLKRLLVFGYFLAFIMTILDMKGGLVFRESVIRATNLNNRGGFSDLWAPGILLIPSILFCCIYFLLSFKIIKEDLIKRSKYFILPLVSIIIYIATALFIAVSYYVYIPHVTLFINIGFILPTAIIIYCIIVHHLFLPVDERVFDKTFWYRTIVIIAILFLYFLGFKLSRVPISFSTFVLLIVSTILILFSHSFYDWLSTFVNDLVYNPSRGFSIVNDEEISNVMKYYNQHERLESSPLMRLNIVNNQLSKNRELTPVDALRSLVKESVEYFKPDTDSTRRIKPNLKYQLLKMFAFDEAEEGQILWELGFDDYPVKILSQERKYRSPLFKVISPSDYTFTSRNAYLALKREAIHDVTWRISYLEKQAKKRGY